MCTGIVLPLADYINHQKHPMKIKNPLTLEGIEDRNIGFSSRFYFMHINYKLYKRAGSCCKNRENNKNATPQRRLVGRR